MRFVRDAVITIVVLVLVIGVLAYARIRAGGLSADAEPGAFERTVASRLFRLSIPPDLDRAANPFAADSNAWRAAVDHYTDHCAICHGSDGRGHTDLGENMYPKVPDLTDFAVQRLSDGALFAVIQNGVRWTGMPAWKREHTADDTWKLVSFVRRVPSLTSEEVQLLQHGRGAAHVEQAHDQERNPGHQQEHDAQPEHQHSEVRH